MKIFQGHIGNIMTTIWSPLNFSAVACQQLFSEGREIDLLMHYLLVSIRCFSDTDNLVTFEYPAKSFDQRVHPPSESPDTHIICKTI